MERDYTPEERHLIALWEQHVRLEFADWGAAATVDTMSDRELRQSRARETGGRGRDEMLQFHGTHFIPRMPSDTAITRAAALSRCATSASSTR